MVPRELRLTCHLLHPKKMPIVCCVYYYRSFEVKTNSTKLTAFVVRVFKIFSSRLPMQLSDQDSIILSVDLAGNIYPAACCGCLLALLGAPDSQTSFQRCHCFKACAGELRRGRRVGGFREYDLVSTTKGVLWWQ